MNTDNNNKTELPRFLSDEEKHELSDLIKSINSGSNTEKITFVDGYSFIKIKEDYWQQFQKEHERLSKEIEKESKDETFIQYAQNVLEESNMRRPNDFEIEKLKNDSIKYNEEINSLNQKYIKGKQELENLKNEINKMEDEKKELNEEKNNYKSIYTQKLLEKAKLENFSKEEYNKYRFIDEQICEKKKQINKNMNLIKEALCVQCKVNLREIYFVKCSHFVLCEACHRKLNNCLDCPVCGQKSIMTIKVKKAMSE